MSQHEDMTPYGQMSWRGIYLSIYLSIHMHACYLSIYLSNYLSTCMHVHVNAYHFATSNISLTVCPILPVLLIVICISLTARRRTVQCTLGRSLWTGERRGARGRAGRGHKPISFSISLQDMETVQEDNHEQKDQRQ